MTSRDSSLLVGIGSEVVYSELGPSAVKYEQDPWPATGLRIDGSAFKLEARSRSSRERRGFRRGDHTSIGERGGIRLLQSPPARPRPRPCRTPPSALLLPLAPIDAAVTRDCATSVRIQAHHAPLTRSSIAHEVAVSISIHPWSVPPPASLHSAAQTLPATLAVLRAAAHAKAHGTTDLLSHPAYTSASTAATSRKLGWGARSLDREPKETGTTTSMSANTHSPSAFAPGKGRGGAAARTLDADGHLLPLPHTASSMSGGSWVCIRCTSMQLRATSGKLGRMERERKEVESNLGARMNTDPTTSTSVRRCGRMRPA
ncbi:hypothetical protein B0H13DRAFT_2312820 [Mycena leptocephala]|nr:hypothetical protein B0H13DRAFT_2312820 [Mycena leptocephala]